MTTDRELLELAAKAAEMGELDFDYPEREGHGFYMGPRLPMPKGFLMAANWSYWNPFTDDGDALRLANKLKLLVGIDGRFVEVMFSNGGYVKELAGRHDPDPDVRRAIVRAAAEIGRAMP